MEWQLIGENEWIFGHKIRGIVRKRLAEVYYTDGNADGRSYGWVWFLSINGNSHPPRGKESNLRLAIEAAEEALQKEGINLDDLPIL